MFKRESFGAVSRKEKPKKMKILDATAGKRGIWFDKKHDETIYLDIRKELKPDIVADLRYLPFRDHSIDLVVFDPPHANLSPKSQMAKQYGSFSTWQIRDIVRRGFMEFDRVLNGSGFVMFKWNTHDIDFRNILRICRIRFKPLFGQKVAYKTKHSSSTYWVCLERKNKVPATLETFC